MNIEKAKRLAKEKLPEKRYNHSLRVAETALNWQKFMMETLVK